MAITSLKGHIMLAIADSEELKTSEQTRNEFAQRFTYLPFTEQYELTRHLFNNILEPEMQYWIMTIANSILKSDNKVFQNSQFKSRGSMVEFFIKNYSYGETEQLRTTIWALMK